MRKLEGGKLVIASHNKGKLREIAALLEPFGIECVSASDLGLEEPKETESTFHGNARIKAHFAASKSGLPALSDDSGIEVDALDGRPGVFTADWAETPQGRDFAMAMTRVWKECEALGAKRPRTARFRCTLCLAWPDGHDEIFDGTAEGQLTWPRRGDFGFGFDPMFVPDGHKLTFGEMTPEEKAPLTHRNDAFQKLVVGCFAG
ncbi:RdgB/HAM1 family non-canonical purine NTP pyrophosphatase [Vannielia sp.]|uniref:RdgB/HAM1 family non-canonical purine NTP pyrophosphatase n=1 Tax=Vannielia sp. TaxID=2813045 RepID=UPI00262F79D8|nr:RdgB/HAM1 family non-canonical purine NTP pyrophosphatase [Vannielia sp.]MDF1873629.1 RdgB/HAM1 family non-canonical purine NTP pyrophosphatase [Vannielia sp.]